MPVEKLIAVASAASSVSSVAYVPVVKPVAEDNFTHFFLLRYSQSRMWAFF